MFHLLISIYMHVHIALSRTVLCAVLHLLSENLCYLVCSGGVYGGASEKYIFILDEN